MRNMPCIKLSERELKYILKRKFFSGGEGMICESSNPNTLYKIFSQRRSIVPMGENKEKKISLLYEKQLDYSIKPISLISFDDIIIGYEMESDYELETFTRYQFTNDELLYFLKETKNILEYFSSNGIVYGDVEFRNILFNHNTGEIKFCDMDNVQIDGLAIDKLSYGLMDYESARGIDDGVHPYMHNRLALRSFDLDPFYSAKQDIKKIFKSGAVDIVKSMQTPKEFKEDYIISYVKKYK